MVALPPLVVVVEDDLALLKALGRVFRAKGFDTAPYGSAEDLLASPPTRTPVCLLLDIQLGTMSGLDLHRTLKEGGSRVPVIMMTAFDDEHLRREALAIGCVGYFDKVQDIDELFVLIESLQPGGPSVDR
jgi:FixJ family two-component response regulator